MTNSTHLEQVGAEQDYQPRKRGTVTDDDHQVLSVQDEGGSSPAGPAAGCWLAGAGGACTDL